jgi:hypothetical protein
MRLLRSISGIDESFIEQAALKRSAAGVSLLRWAKPLAACLLVAVAIALPLIFDAFPGSPPAEVVLPDSPESTGFTLHFNQLARRPADSARINLPMMFNQVLTESEIRAIFPALHQARTVTAAANFFYYDSSLYNIEAQVSSSAGLTTTVLVARDRVVLDYGLGKDVETSDVMGTSVTAGYTAICPNSETGRSTIYLIAEFQLGGMGYYTELVGDASQEKEMRRELAEVVALLVSGGAADSGILNPSRPEGWRSDRLTLEEACADGTFGRFIPQTIPEEYLFESALRTVDLGRDELFICWMKGMGALRWQISPLGDKGWARLTSVAATKNYDLSLYPTPWADSVPAVLREIVENPIFQIDELTPEVVNRRALEIADSGDEPGTRLHFGVLYGDVVVEIDSKGVPVEKIYQMLLSVK